MNRALRLLLPLAVVACQPELSVGSDVEPSPVLQCGQPVIASCPPSPWGGLVTFDSSEALKERLLGRWLFCGGEARYNGRGAITGIPLGVGFEVWADEGVLRYAFLASVEAGLQRRDVAGTFGTLRLEVTGGRGRVVLIADDGYEAVWETQFSAEQPVMQNVAFDVWTFVRAPP